MLIAMSETITLQGRELAVADIHYIQQMIISNPSWSRRRLSIALCEAWNWRNAKGAIKDMACRTLLVKLHNRGTIELPARRRTPPNRMVQRQIRDVAHDTCEINTALKHLRPLKVIPIHQHKSYEDLYNCLLSRYHYLGYRSPVGENIKYLILDNQDRPLACLLFGSSAWSSADRDRFIGWDKDTRQRHINLTTNNTRFLVLPWVKVPHLASHILGLISRRIKHDWEQRYGHPVYLLETFVEQNRFRGICYQAANWQHVGQTQGRGRNDRDHAATNVPIKSIFLYPLVPDFKEKLTA